MRQIYPAYIPSNSFSYSINENGVPIAEANKTTRQRKKAGDFDVEVKINQYGLRDVKDMNESKPEDIFVVGDSFSFGYGVEEEERYSNILGHFVTDTNIYNVCIPTDILGYGKLIEYANQNGAQIENIILGLCMENDLLIYDSLATIPPSNVSGKHGFLGGIKTYFNNNSCLYNYVASQIQHNKKTRNVFKKLGLIKDNISNTAQNTLNEDILTSTISMLKKVIRGKNVLVVIIPSRSLWIGDNQAEESLIHEKLISLLEREKINTIDIRPIFENSGNPLQYHFKNDGHWNKDGHKIVAETINKHWLSN